MAKTSPSARSVRHLREKGYHVAVVEKWVPRINIRKDVFEWGDLLAVHPSEAGAVLVQTTTMSNASARAKKAGGNASLIAWLVAGNRLLLHGWRKLKKTGWTVSERWLTLQDVNGEAKVTG